MVAYRLLSHAIDTFDMIIERWVEDELNFADEVAEVLIVYSSHIANPFVSIQSVSFYLFAHRES